MRCYLPPDTGKRVPSSPQPDRPVLDLHTPEGWKAQLSFSQSFPIQVVTGSELSIYVDRFLQPVVWQTSCLFLAGGFYARMQLMLSARLSHRNSVRPSVRLSVTRVDQSKTVQARITKSSPSAAWKTLVSGNVKLFHKFEGRSLWTRALNERWEKFAIFSQ